MNTDKRTLTVFSDEKPFKQYPVCVGKPETPTPIGEFKIISKDQWSGGFGTRWMRVGVPWGQYGIHGTNKPWSIGQSLSGGCIRMFNQDVEEIFPWIPVGTPVHIIGETRKPPWFGYRELIPGDSGPDVVETQTILRKNGLFWGETEGEYNWATILGVTYYQLYHHLPPTGKINLTTYQALGIFKD